MISVQLVYTKVPVDMESMIEVSNGLVPVKPRPIATPIDSDNAKAIIKPVALPQENPERTKLAPRDTDATKWWIAIVRKRKAVVENSFWIPTAMPSKMLCVHKAITIITLEVLLRFLGSKLS